MSKKNNDKKAIGCITGNAPYWGDFKGTKPSELPLMDYGTYSVRRFI